MSEIPSSRSCSQRKAVFSPEGEAVRDALVEATNIVSSTEAGAYLYRQIASEGFAILVAATMKEILLERDLSRR